ncbi:hypothetical protein [Crossiella cryophila]|uniref:Uncharacterized protein n=1 Tax=Crossiella cryophila TaxID=43355 RepID=A0A7W7CG70_9PSEU|nr:hypothetical protein [Crossiella cryophila]MBB4680636.1 hypothetical protein [Crossiella cryophila]
MSNHTEVNQIRRPGSPVSVPLLWVLAVLTSAVNSLGFLVGVPFAASLAAGCGSVVCIALLITYYVRRRARS